MIRYLFLIFIPFIILLSACNSEKNEKVISQTYQDGSPKIIQYFRKVDGIRVLIKEEGFYQNKNRQFEGTYTNGRKNGVWKTWYENGKLWSETSFKDDVNHGKTMSFHPNGKKYYEGQYTNGARSGHWRFWDENGILVKELDN